jgi:hypothetical protein
MNRIVAISSVTIAALFAVTAPASAAPGHGHAAAMVRDHAQMRYPQPPGGPQGPAGGGIQPHGGGVEPDGDVMPGSNGVPQPGDTVWWTGGVAPCPCADSNGYPQPGVAAPDGGGPHSQDVPDSNGGPHAGVAIPGSNGGPQPLDAAPDSNGGPHSGVAASDSGGPISQWFTMSGACLSAACAFATATEY